MEIGFQAAIGIHRERRVRAVLNYVVRQCGTRIGQMQRRDHLRDSSHNYLTTPVLQLGVVYVVQEDAFVLVEETRGIGLVDVITELDATPVASLRRRRANIRIGVVADRGIVDRSKAVSYTHLTLPTKA